MSLSCREFTGAEGRAIEERVNFSLKKVPGAGFQGEMTEFCNCNETTVTLPSNLLLG